MDGEVAIKVESVSKDFLLPHEKITTIKSLFTGFYKRQSTTETQHALSDVSFEVKKGEFFGIVGRNGSGKSTLLKILAGIYQPTQGYVQTTGRLVPFIELGVGFNPELTGRENVYLNGAMMGFSTNEVDAMYDDIVGFAELSDFMDQKLKNYSSGMQVRLAFSVAIRSEADILLVDEVLAVGDADFQRKCYKFFKSLKRNNKTVIFVSHDMNAIREYCDRAILISDSKLAVEGKAEFVSQAYLKLFNEESDDEEIQIEGDNRWGNKWIVFENVKAEIIKNQINVTCSVRANRDISEVVYGFRIRSEDGTELLGTNSDIIKQPRLELKAGKKAAITWQTDDILSNGQFYVDPSLIMHNGATVCDWWNEAARLKAERDTATSYPVSPEISVKLEAKAK